MKDDFTILFLKYKKKNYLVRGMTDLNPKSKYRHIYFVLQISCMFMFISKNLPKNLCFIS